MSRIIILHTADQKRFDAAPSFNIEERALYFALNKEELAVITKLKNPGSKIGFILQLGYFKSQGKFFTTGQFRKSSRRGLAAPSSHTTVRAMSHTAVLVKLLPEG